MLFFESFHVLIKRKVNRIFSLYRLFVIGINLLIIILCLMRTAGLNYLWAEDISEFSGEKRVELSILSAAEGENGVTGYIRVLEIDELEI